MQLTIQRAAVQAKVSETTIRRWIKDGKIQGKKNGRQWVVCNASLEEYLSTRGQNAKNEQAQTDQAAIVSGIIAGVVAEIKPLVETLSKSDEEPNLSGQETKQEIDSLKQENRSLRAQIAGLESEVAAVNACVEELQSTERREVEKLRKELEECKRAIAEQQEQMKAATSVASATMAETSAGDKEEEITDEEKEMEEQLRSDLSWLDERSPFQKTRDRSWRQLASNQGEKIAMNGKGYQKPRAYLHAIASWKESKMESRLKAKIALVVCKKGQ